MPDKAHLFWGKPDLLAYPANSVVILLFAINIRSFSNLQTERKCIKVSPTDYALFGVGEPATEGVGPQEDPPPVACMVPAIPTSA